jgi:diadenosine tetraphosphate (Ap4A) HIT family hydrolase
MNSCIFCKIVAGRAGAHQIYEDEHFLAFLDIYPVRPGHTLLIPRQHGQFLSDFEPGQCGELFALAQRLGGAIRRSAIPCDDINFVLNDGPAANQTVPHVHLHLLPRTGKDLHRVAAVLARRPIQPLLGSPASHRLEEQAQAIRDALW